VIAAMAKDNKSPQIIALVAAFTGLGFVCVVLRFFSRIKLVGIVGLEDYFIALSMVSIWKRCCFWDQTYWLMQAFLDIYVSVFDTRRKVWQRQALDQCTNGKRNKHLEGTQL
jgi:hypothetical protein